MLPPPDITWQVHWTQVPPPPQADGKKIPSFPRVVNKVDPPSTSITLSPFIVILTLPDATKNVFANSKIAVSVKTMINKKMIGVIISIYKLFIQIIFQNP